MAVIIADMNEVPMNCFECDLHNYHFCDLTGNCIESNIDDNTRADDCPLKEVNENKPFKKEFYRTMREVTPEEQEAINRAIRDMSYDTGVTLQGLLDHEKYIPMSVLEQIKDEIEEKGFNSPMMNPVFTMTEILEIIDKHIIGEEQGEAE